MTKILIDKDETIVSLIQKVGKSADSSVTLVIPKNAAIKEEEDNFSFLKREAETAGKTIIIESVDEDILTIAKSNGFEANHPLFRSDHARRLSDIVEEPEREILLQPKKRGAGKVQTAKTKKDAAKGKLAAVRVEKITANKTEKIVSEPIKEDISEVAPAPSRAVTAPRPEGVIIRTSLEEPRRNLPLFLKPNRFLPQKRLFRWGIPVFFVVVLGFWGISMFFARAEVILNFKKTPWQYEHLIRADKSIGGIEVESHTLPAELFTESKNTAELFPASGRDRVTEKAKGAVTIYNAYSSEPQSLVATTRFETPDGKIFRLDARTIVPGAEIKDGKITPSSIEANVTADSAGADYNVGPVERLAIPGFKDTPKYEGFYGAFTKGTSGGFIGEKAVPLPKDITDGKAKVEEVLTLALQSRIFSKIPQEFKILDDAKESKITKISATDTTDDQGNFNVFGEAELRALGFREADLVALLTRIAEKDYPGQAFRNYTFTYADISKDFEKGLLVFSLKAETTLATAFDADTFKSETLGKKIKDVRAEVASLKGLDNAKISFYPFWLRTIPKNASRFTVTVE